MMKQEQQLCQEHKAVKKNQQELSTQCQALEKEKEKLLEEKENLSEEKERLANETMISLPKRRYKLWIFSCKNLRSTQKKYPKSPICIIIGITALIFIFYRLLA